MATIRGTEFGDDLIAGSRLGDEVFGLGGNDILRMYALNQSDKFYGGSGNDELLANTVKPNDAVSGAFSGTVFDGGDGYDTISFRFESNYFGFEIKPLPKVLQLNGFGLTLTGIEKQIINFVHFGPGTFFGGGGVVNSRVVGSALDEDIIYDYSGRPAIDMKFDLKGGEDSFVISATTDSFSGMTVLGGNGNDRYENNSAGIGGLIANGGSGNDTFIGSGLSAERIIGGTGSDAYVIDDYFDFADTVSTGRGNDRFLVVAERVVGSLTFNPPESGGLRITDFDAKNDKFIFLMESFYTVSVNFSSLGTSAVIDLFVDNANGKIYFNDVLFAEFISDAPLTASNFSFTTDRLGFESLY